MLLNLFDCICSRINAAAKCFNEDFNRLPGHAFASFCKLFRLLISIYSFSLFIPPHATTSRFPRASIRVRNDLNEFIYINRQSDTNKNCFYCRCRAHLQLTSVCVFSPPLSPWFFFFWSFMFDWAITNL